jgi:hypothetical protein
LDDEVVGGERLMPAPGAPVHMVVDATDQWLFTVLHFAVAAAVTVWLWRRQDRSTRTITFLVLLGGGLALVAEPFFDRMGFIWQAQVGQWTVLKMFGHSEPLWMLPVYYWYVGGQTLYILGRLRAGISVGEIWKLYAVFCVLDAALELPVLYIGGVYTYFGHQPFWNSSWLPLPVWYVFVNAVLPFAGATAVLVLSALRDRRFLCAVPVVIPLATFATFTAVAWPVWAALNADVSWGASYVAGTATVALTLLVCAILAEVSVRIARRESASFFWSAAAAPTGALVRGAHEPAPDGVR